MKKHKTGIYRGGHEKKDECIKEQGVLLKKLFTVNADADNFLANGFSFNNNFLEEKEELDLRHDLIEPVLIELIPEMNQRNILFDNRTISSNGDPAVVKGNRNLLQSVLKNLILNAINNGRTQSIMVFDLTCHDACFRIKVFNTENLLLKKDRKQIVNIFNSGNKLNGMNAGAGSGLYFSRQIIQIHGGKIWYEASHCGSSFVVKLPRHYSGLNNAAGASCRKGYQPVDSAAGYEANGDGVAQ